MKKLLLFLITLSLAGLLQAQKSDSEKAVQQSLLKLFEALSDRDSSALKTYCTGDVLFFEYGMVWTLDTLIRRAIIQNQSADFKRINTLDFISTTVDHNVAWTAYRNKADITANGKQRTVEWIETVVLVREKKIWKVRLLHSTLIKRE